MDLDNAPESENVEDRRGMSPGLAIGGAGGIILLVLGLIFGVNFNGNNPAVGPGGNDRPNGDPKTVHFMKKILGTTERVWTEEFRRQNKTYRPPELVLFTGAVDSGCGRAPSSVGPFYCPRDQKVYLDPTFFDELEQRLGGSKAEFSQAYVIAHEVGHHVQNLLGYSKQSNDNDFSVRLELQADYLAGVWAKLGQRDFNFIQPGDVEAAIKTAGAIGDDRLQKRSGGFVNAETFTHGTSEQRIAWFKDGLATGDASKRKLDYFFEGSSSRNLMPPPR